MSDPAPVVVKVGGGLLATGGMEAVRRACAEAAEAARRRPVLVVPGGGPFADAVRTADAQLGLGDDLAHALALRAMDQLGLLLRPHLPGCEVVDRLAAPAGLALLAVAFAFDARPDVPRSWAVTSDSLAVLAAGAVGAELAILLKPAPPRLPDQVTAAELAALQRAGDGDAVDAYLPEAVRRTGVPVLVRAPGARSGAQISPG